MKTYGWLLSVLLCLGSCKHQNSDPSPVLTRINVTVVDEQSKPIPKVEIYIGGSKGDYFSGTRQDTTFVPAGQFFTDSTGFASFQTYISPKWAVIVSLAPPYNGLKQLYELVNVTGTVDGQTVRVGQVNNVTATMRKL